MRKEEKEIWNPRGELSPEPSGPVPRYRLWALVFVVGLVLFAPARAAQADFFPFSVWYSGGKARAPMLEEIGPGSRDRWKRDLQQIKDLGYNTVRTWVEWTANEPRPDEYDFSNLKLLAELAGEVGLKVFVQVYTDSAPDWVGDRWRDARFVAQSGGVVPSQSAPGYCFDHPEVRDKILRFYRESARVASKFPNFVGWDLWSEPHIINWAIIDFIPNATFCYCPHSIRRFQGWLEGKYGSLQGLNQAWYRTFTDWRQVEPPRFGTILSYTDFIDWRIFVQEKLAEDLRLKAEAVREVDGTKVTTSHAAVPSLFTSPLWGVGAPDDWRMVKSVDYWGTSIYPKHSFPERHWSLLTLTSLMDFIRSSGRKKGGFYVGELQAGMGVRGTVVGDPVRYEDQRLWILGMLSRGARAINVYAYYPMNSGYEAGGYGLINLDGTPTERSRGVGGLARLVDRNQELFLQGVPARAEIALVYNPLSYLVGGEQHLSRSGAVRDSLQGIYRAFRSRNIPIDFVHLHEVEAGELSSYKVVFLPYPLMLTRKSAEALETFVAAGGTLVAEARCGWNDERGYSQDVIPGFGLHQVFGVREGFLKMEDQVELSVVGDSMPGLSGGDLLKGLGIIEELEPEEGTEVLARFPGGQAAITSKAYGKGRAIAVGTFLGMAAGQERDRNTELFFTGVAEAEGIGPVLEIGGLSQEDEVEVRVLETERERVVFFFNYEDRPVTLTLPFDRAADLETGAEFTGSRLSLASREIRIFKLPR